jgi:hypothetical protein
MCLTARYYYIRARYRERDPASLFIRRCLVAQVAHFVAFIKQHASTPVTLDNPEYQVNCHTPSS